MTSQTHDQNVDLHFPKLKLKYLPIPVLNQTYLNKFGNLPGCGGGGGCLPETVACIPSAAFSCSESSTLK